MSGTVAEALLRHHLEDVRKGIQRRSLEIARFSLDDAFEILKEVPRRISGRLLKRYGYTIMQAQEAVMRMERGY